MVIKLVIFTQLTKFYSLTNLFSENKVSFLSDLVTYELVKFLQQLLTEKLM